MTKNLKKMKDLMVINGDILIWLAWKELVRIGVMKPLKCASAYSGDKPKLKLWSFEVKKEITKSASRGCFFSNG